MINIISAISAAGMAIGTAALILILSVYNGFDKIIKANMSDLDPDVLVTAAEGKHFVPEGEAWDALMDDRRVASITSVIEDNVFLRYHDKQAIARAKGVDGTFEEVSGLGAHLIDGTFTLMKGEVPQGAFGSAVARNQAAELVGDGILGSTLAEPADVLLNLQACAGIAGLRQLVVLRRDGVEPHALLPVVDGADALRSLGSLSHPL